MLEKRLSSSTRRIYELRPTPRYESPSLEVISSSTTLFQISIKCLATSADSVIVKKCFANWYWASETINSLGHSSRALNLRKHFESAIRTSFTVALRREERFQTPSRNRWKFDGLPFCHMGSVSRVLFVYACWGKCCKGSKWRLISELSERV